MKMRTQVVLCVACEDNIKETYKVLCKNARKLKKKIDNKSGCYMPRSNIWKKMRTQLILYVACEDNIQGNSQRGV